MAHIKNVTSDFVWLIEGKKKVIFVYSSKYFVEGDKVKKKKKISSLFRCVVNVFTRKIGITFQGMEKGLLLL